MHRQAIGAILLAILLAATPPGTGAAQERAEAEAPIRLQAATFFPSRGEPDLPPELRLTALAQGVRGTYLVQFRGPVQDAWKDVVVAAGGEIIEYIPDFAFKVRLTAAQVQAVRQLASVRWVGVFHPAYKLSPRLRRGGERLYTVRLEEGSDATAVAVEIAAAGMGIASREGPVLVVTADEARLTALANVPDVAWIENFELRRKHNEYAGQTMGAPAAWASGYDGSTQTVAVADTGLGGGTAATAHANIPASRISSIFNWPGIAGDCFDSITDDGARDVDTGHGTHVTGSVLGGGNASGKGKGTAPGAHLVFQAVENWAQVNIICQILLGLPDGYYLVGIPTDLRTLFQQAYDAGARIHSSSWGSGTNGDYTVDSQNLDDFVSRHRDAVLTFSAGNGGVDADGNGGVDARSLSSQPSAKNVIAVGASENDRASDYACDTSLTHTTCAAQGGQNQIFTYGSAWPTSFPVPPLSSDPSAGGAQQMAAFSSRGPSDDGRIKPDVVAPGTWVLSTYSDLYQQGYDPSPNPQSGSFQYEGWGFPPSSGYKYLGGTSMSSPLVAGAAAVVRDYYQKAHAHPASAALVKATLVNSAVDLLDEDNDGVNNNALPIPNVYEGWGRVSLAAAVDGSRLFRDEGPALSTGGVLSYTYDVAAGTPLKVTLVWTDPPAALSSYSRLVNDLDLEVAGPGGILYKGNVFSIGSGGWTVPNTGLPDRANTVENVYVQSPAAGGWTVTVRAHNVPLGPQSFALVVAGQSAQPLRTLTVTPPVHGKVASQDGFISCGTAASACSHAYDDGASVPLEAVPDAGYVLSAWTGACSGAGGCTVNMTEDRTVGAIFAPTSPLPALTIADVTVAEGDSGTVAARFTVSLSAASGSTVTVGWTTADGTATAGSDYVTGSGTLSFAPGETGGTVSVTVNGDTSHEPDETFTVTLSDPDGATIADGSGTGTITDDDPAPPATPARMDLDGDGKNDLLWRYPPTGDLVAWYMDGVTRKRGAALSPARPGSTSWVPVGVADFNADSQPDILFRHQAGGDLVVWYMNGVTRTGGAAVSPPRPGGASWVPVGVADFNADGKPDILFRHQGGGDLVVWYMDGVTKAGGAALSAKPGSTDWTPVGVADFNADGKPDILFRHQPTGQHVVWSMNGVTKTGGAALVPAGPQDTRWRAVALADYNLDGKTDIVWQFVATGDLSVWYMDGVTRVGGAATIPPAVTPPWEVVAPR